MGHFRGEIKLQTSQGKKREKLYGKWAGPPPPRTHVSPAGLGTGVSSSLEARHHPCWVDGETGHREVQGLAEGQIPSKQPAQVKVRSHPVLSWNLSTCRGPALCGQRDSRAHYMWTV